MKLRILFSLLGLSFLLTSHCRAQVTIENLYFNSTQNIIRLNFSTATPEVNYTGIGAGTSIGEGIAHAEDGQGNVVIWVNASGVYDKTGTLMPGSLGIWANPSSTEIIVCPVPAQVGKYYIFYNNQLCSQLYYSIVDLSLRGGLGDLTQLNKPLDAPNLFAEGLEVVRIPCTDAYWLLSYQCGTGFKRFKIDQNGIGVATLIHPYTTNEPGGRGELDYHHGKLGYAITFKNRAFVATFDPVSGAVSNAKEVVFSAINGMYGLEFSPDASKLYATDWNNRNLFGNVAGPNLFQYDFNTETIRSWTIPYDKSQCNGAIVEGLGQIELGRDGNLYIPHVKGCQISVVKSANSPNPTFDKLDVNTILSTGVSDHIQSSFFLPLQITAVPTVCPGDSVLLTVNGGSNHQWRAAPGLTQTNAAAIYAKPTVTTVYTAYADNQYGCRDSASVTISLKSSAAAIRSLDGAIVCGNNALRLVATAGMASYNWLKDNVSIPNQTGDTLVVQVAGSYTVQVQSPEGCTSTSPPFDVSQRDFPVTAIVAQSGKTTLCQGEKDVLHATKNSAYAYQWYRNNVLLAGKINDQLEITEGGAYTVQVTYQAPLGSCPVTVATSVDMFDSPVVALGEDRTSCLRNEIILEAGNQVEGASIRWQEMNSGKTFSGKNLSVTKTGTYSLTVTNGPCTRTDEVQITIEDDGQVAIPNVFTPNGDSHNEFFTVNNAFGTIQLRMYNRWGKEVYRNNHYQNDWNASELNVGVYYYAVSSSDACFSRRKGWVQVLR